MKSCGKVVFIALYGCDSLLILEVQVLQLMANSFTLTSEDNISKKQKKKKPIDISLQDVLHL